MRHASARRSARRVEDEQRVLAFISWALHSAVTLRHFLMIPEVADRRSVHLPAGAPDDDHRRDGARNLFDAYVGH